MHGNPLAAAESLRFHRCTFCTTPVQAIAELCPACGSDRLTVERSSGVGRVHRALKATSARGAEPSLPVVVELVEGFRIRSWLDGLLPGAAPVGTPVRFVGYARAAGGARDPRFALNG
ncbi:Zn-ribbon domain-containing OB-fold protein [Phaeacidiphilus oryzae]|uniref:Zn-ribbon domain-containing OB-fold protein n=1 Tax=Phaeacidiphilus oryzae TaxID=348818 RepID=UPI000A4D5CD1|nr:hypothetical protein [Phaeacidiphilus oryzae]